MDITEENKTANPRAKANFLSLIFFGYAFPLFWEGYKKPLDIDNIYVALKSERSDQLGEKLERNWNKHLESRRKKKKNPNFFLVLAKTFSLEYFFLGIVAFFVDIIFKILEPPLIGNLLLYFKRDSTMPIEEAMIYAGGLVIINLITAFGLAHRIFLAFKFGINAKAACCSLIYRKSLKLSRNALKGTESGRLVNLLSSDVQTFERASLAVHALWTSPLSVIISMTYLYFFIGFAGIIGFTPIILIVLLQVYTGNLLSKFRLQTAYKTDERVRLMDEIIYGIQVIKMYAWEKPFEKLITIIRTKELKIIKKSILVKGFFRTFTIFGSRVALFCALLFLVMIQAPIEASTVFVMLSYYNIIGKLITTYFVRSLSEFVEFLAAIKRLQEFFLLEEIEDSKNIIKSQIKNENHAIECTNVTATWNCTSSETVLQNVTCNFSKGMLIGIIGNVGSGKSSLLQTLLGQIDLTSGHIAVNGSFSYSSQESWLFTATIRQNITFCEEYNKEKYRKVLSICALEKDLEMFENGDSTIIGDKGASLSGGQKARINLARALYRNADIYLLDDPLSAVDTHVAKHIFDECIKKYLKGKTVILVTHQIHFLIDADHILFIDEGKIQMEGNFEQLANNSNEYYRKLLSSTLENHENNKNNSSNIKNEENIELTTSSLKDVNADKVKIKVMQEDSLKTVKGNLFFEYLKSGNNVCFILFVMTLFLISQVIISSSDYYISIWVKIEELRAIITNVEEKASLLSTEWCLYIFGIFLLILLVLTTLSVIFFLNISMRSSSTLHNNMFIKILHARMRFFDINPSGRILNRFSKDLNAVDELLPVSILETAQLLLLVVGLIVTISIVNPIFLAFTFILFLCFYYMRKFYIKTSTDLKRLDSITKSPVFTHIGATVKGLSIVRAFNAEEILQKEFDKHQDLHTSAATMFIVAYAAFGLYAEFLSFIFRSIVTFSFFIMGKAVFGDEVGLAITQAATLTGTMQFGVKQSAEIENYLVSVERSLEYGLLPEEKQPLVPHKPKQNWPENGKIIFKNTKMRYDTDNPLVLKNLNFKIAPCEKVGIVGRTGSGKSSLIAALFRLAFVEGKIEIDSIDTETVILQDLRSKISIIPQDPVLFSGTLRYNLDPFGKYGDDVLYGAIKDVKLEDPSNIINNLDYRVMDRGTNYSTGQKQLICLARAIIRNNKILVLDEATANVDPQTDEFIQSVIRERFAECTILTVAHRLNTIIDSDKIIVMDEGTVIECSHPFSLLQNPGSVFYGMVESAGILEKFMEVSTKKYEKIKSE